MTARAGARGRGAGCAAASSAPDRAERLLNSSQVAARLGCTRDRILHLRVEGGHPLFNGKAIKLGTTAQSQLRWRESDVEAWIEQHEAGKTWR